MHQPARRGPSAGGAPATTHFDSAEVVEPTWAFAELAKISLGERSLAENLQQIADLARRALPGIDDTSITVLDGSRPRTIVFTSALAVHLDERQYTAGSGPCLDCAVTGTTIVLAHDNPDPIYAEFSRAARRSGVVHTVSVSLLVPHRHLGALNLYSSNPAPPSAETVALAERFAGYAAVAVANADHLHNAEEIARQMRTAMASRATIEQAKGVLMARHGYDADEAFAHLAKLSQHANRKLRDLAADIVAQATRTV
jgi:GAF domain-containing protein